MASEQDIIQLMKYIDTGDPEALAVVLSRNFREIEAKVGSIGALLKGASGGSVSDFAGAAAGWTEARSVAAAALVAAGAESTIDGVINGYFQNDEPATGMGYGDIWIDIDKVVPPDSTCIYRYEGAAGGDTVPLTWTLNATDAIGQIYLSAYNASLITGGMKTFYQNSVPVSTSVGDFWVDTDDDNKLYRAAIVGADAIVPGEWELGASSMGLTRSSTTFVVADTDTSSNIANADFKVPTGSITADVTINAAIAALPSTGGRIMLLEGTYYVSNPIVLPSNVTLEGQGANTILKLSSARAQWPSFRRRTPAYDLEGNYYEGYVPRFRAGRLGNGIFLENGAANLLTENQATAETNTTGFVAMGSVTITRDTAEHFVGSACLKVVTNNAATAEGFYVTFDPADNTSKYPGSIYLKGSGTVTLRVRDVTNAVSATKNITLTSSWVRHEACITTTLASTDLRIEVYTQSQQAATIYADCLMVEEDESKTQATCWAKPSFARQVDLLSATQYGLFDVDAWAIEFIFRSITPTTGTGIIRGIWAADTDATGNYILLGIDATGHLFLASYSGGVVAGIITDSAVLAANTSYTIMATANGSNLRLCKDGAQVGADTAYTKPVGIQDPEMGFGTIAGIATDRPDMVLEDIRLSNKYRTLAEHQAYYNGATYHVADANTQLLAPLNGVIDAPVAIVTNADHTNGNSKISVLSLKVDGNSAYYCPEFFGILLRYVSSSKLAYCDVVSTKDVGIMLEFCSDIHGINCHVDGAGQDGIFALACDDVALAGCVVENCAYSGIQLRYESFMSPVGLCDRGIVSGCVCRSNQDGIAVDGGDDNIITGCNCSENEYVGITVGGYQADNCCVSNNITKLNGRYGIEVGADNSSISNNVVKENSQLADNTYAGIFLVDGAYLSVQGNVVRYGATANHHKYGIEVNCDNSTITNNDIQLSGDTAAIVDTGTGNTLTAGNHS